MGLLGALLSSPVKGLEFVLNSIKDQADGQLYDPELWQQKLMDLQLRLETDEIDAETYTVQEEVILAQLDLIYANLAEQETSDDDDFDDDFDSDDDD